MKDLEINYQGLLSIDTIGLPINCVVVISDGVAKVRELPEHGEYKIVTHQGKVRRMRKEEGEDF
ncbi:XtrA/YqaO family protein [Mammaliicoccus sciuri]